MRKTALGGVLFLLTLVLTAAAGYSQSPIQLGGHLATPEPLPVADGIYEVTLLLRSQPAGGELLWEQSYPEVRIRNGSIRSRLAGPPAGLDYSGSWLEILIDGWLASGPTEINANEQNDSLSISDGVLTFETFDFSEVGRGYIYYSFNPYSTDEYWLTLENHGFINLKAHDESVLIYGENGVEISGRLEVGDNWCNATLEDRSGCLMIGYEDGQNLVFDDNEIQARNDGVEATLFLQHQGGQVRIDNAVVLTSDRRKKRAIRDLELGLDEILRLRPISFEWKDQVGPRRPGLVAQEVREVIEEIVAEDDDGTLGLAYGSLIPVLVRSIQEQHAEIEQLRADLEALKAEVSRG